MRQHTRTLRRSTLLVRASLVSLLPILAAIVAACGRGNGGSAY
ncbi:MAG TPA: hypothetical protein VFL03_16440 [Candidatus Limnocylindrales bacterium]|nr:hypothetical protein [Candidatus Limnocylindrales bacterium]